MTVSATSIETSTASAVRQHQRLEERAGQALEEEDRHDRDDVDQRRVGDRASHLHRGVEDDSEGRRLAASARAWRSRRTMFSTSMIASSTTTPMATTSPASTITLIVAPAVEHQDRGDQRQRDRDQADERGAPLEQEGDDDQDHQQRRRAAARCQVVDRLLDEGRGPEDRRVDLDPGQAGPHLVIAASTPSVTSRVLAPRILLDDQQQAGPSLTTASPRAAGGPRPTSPRSARRSVLPSRSSDRHLRRARPAPDRLHVPDVEPLAAGLDEAAGADHDAVGVLQQARRPGRRPWRPSPARSETPCSASLAGSTCTCRCWSRSPQMATCATPGTRSSRCRIFQ